MVSDDFSVLTGRRFKIIYRNLREILHKESLSENSKLYVVEGIIENFNPSTIIISDDNYGFNIICMKTVVEMIEIKVKE